MKRLAVFTIFMTIILALPVWVEAETAGSFTFVKGRVDITSPGEKARPVETGGIVNVGDIVRTKTGAKAEITFKDGSIVRLAQGSRMKINEYMIKKNQRRSLLSLFRGKLQGIVKRFAGFAFGRKRKNRFEVHTPTAVSGVRGTNFFTWFVNGVSGSAVKEGNVYVYPKNNPTFTRNITVGQAVVVKSASAPPVVKPATDVEIQQHIKDTAPEKEKTKKAAAVLAETGIEAGLKETAEETGLENTVETITETIADTGLDVVEQENIKTIVEDFGGLSPVEVLKYEEVVSESAGSTFFAGDLNLSFLDTGSISGFIENDPQYPSVLAGNGGITLVGSYSGAGPAAQAGFGTTNGVMDDQTAFSGFLGGVPGSWKGLFNSIYISGGTFVNEGTDEYPSYILYHPDVGYLYGALSGSFGDGKIAAGGTAYRSNILGQVDSISLGNVPEGQNIRETLASSLASMAFATDTVPLPDLSSINVGNAVNHSGMDNQGPLSTITATKGTSVRKLGIWMDPLPPQSYQNTTGAGTWQAIYGQHDGSGSYYLLGVINGTDDKAGQLATGEVGHVSVTGSLGYMDHNYYGDITLWHKGTYDPSGSYDSLTAGTFTRYPLAYSGDWGVEGGCLFTHENGDMVWAGSDWGIIGGRTSPWDNPTSELIVYGQYDPSEFGDLDSYLFNTIIEGSDSQGQILEGFGGGIWKIKTANSSNQVNYGTTYGSAVALYKDKSENMGLMASKDIAGVFYPDVHMFNALGTWVKDDPRLTGGFGAVTKSYFDFAYLAGQFTGDSSIYGSLYILNDGTTKYFTLSDGTSPSWGIYEFKLGSGNYYYNKTGTWTAKLGGKTQFGASLSDSGYFLADIANGTWSADQHAEINGTMDGDYLTETHIGKIGGPFYGINTGTINGESSSWAGESIGIYESIKELDFGGSASGDLSYDYDGYTEWSGEVDNTFGLIARNDGSYDFMTLGDYSDDGYGAEGYGGPYILSSSFSGDEIKGNGDVTSNNFEAFSAGIWQNTDPEDMMGEVNGHVVAITLQDNGTVSLLSGDANGVFYHMYYGMYGNEGMWKTNGVLEKNDKITGQTNLVSYSPVIDDWDLDAKLAGSFAGNAGSVFYGNSYEGITEFIRYTLPESVTASLPWGIHYLNLAGEGTMLSDGFFGKPSGTTSWSAKIGGEGTFGFDENTDGHGFWLADINGTWREYQPGAGHGTIDGIFSNGIYLSTTQMGDIDGWLYGLYHQDGACEITGLGYGTWVAESVGTYTGQMLDLDGAAYWGGNGDGGILNYDDQSPVGINTGLIGVIKETAPDFDNFLPGTLTYRAMGKYTYMGSTGQQFPYVWGAPIFDEDPTSGGLQIGLSGGIWSNDGMDGNFIAVASDLGEGWGYGGIIATPLSGKHYDLFSDVYETEGIWVAQGKGNYAAWYIPMADYPVTGDPVTSDLFFTSSTGVFNSFNGPGGDIIAFDNQDWGVWGIYMYGGYSGTPADYWPASLDGEIKDDVNGSPVTTGNVWTNILGNQWSDHEIRGKVAGAWVDLDEMTTGVAGGDLKGTFDPNNWQAIIGGTMLETQKFMRMADPADPKYNPTALTALNIPFAKIGKTTLTGAWQAGQQDSMAVTLADVTFFAYSTGATPQIWATKDVNGTYTGNPAAASMNLTQATGDFAPLNNATFGINKWDTGNSQWAADVNGAGTIDSHDIEFKGGAAGTIDSVPVDSTPGGFSGTGAGIVHPTPPD